MLRSLASLKITEVLLSWIALLCIAATIIPQIPYRPTDGIPLLQRFVMLLSLRDVFHSLWFIGPVLALMVNMLACMAVRMKVRPNSRNALMPATGLTEVKLPLGMDPQTLRQGLARVVSEHYTLTGNGDEREPAIAGERGRARRFAPLIVHGSLFLILVGVVLAFSGYKGTMEIPEGHTLDVVTLYDGTQVRLPFAVRCDRFGIEYYAGGMPREYRSDVSFISKGVEVLKRPVLVNHPVSYEGILFSQSGYNELSEASLAVSAPWGTQRFIAAQGSVIDMGGTGYRVHVMRIVPDMMRMGPGMQLLVETPEGRHMLWLFRDIQEISREHPGITEEVPQFNPSLVKPYTFALEAVTVKPTTILGVNRDPGVPLVAAGSVLFVVGICMIFLMVHERVWVVVDEDRGILTVRLAQRRNNRAVQVDGRLLEEVDRLAGSAA
jgi:cytochrome c biogenesis protein